MSDPTYRIDVQHDPHSESLPWDGRIFRLSDDQLVHITTGKTPDEAETLACEWVAAENVERPFRSLFVDDDGQRVEAHSVKAS